MYLRLIHLNAEFILKNNSQLKTNPLHRKLDNKQIKDIKDLLGFLVDYYKCV